MTASTDTALARSNPEWTYEIVLMSGKEEAYCYPVKEPASAHALYGFLCSAYRAGILPDHPEIWVVRNGTVRTLIGPEPTL